MKFPDVSIIIPAYNAQDTIKTCLDSMMKLDYPQEKIEIIMVDNNSTDSTWEIARGYPITVLRQMNVQSSYASRNLGIESAKGDILAFTDTDCSVSPQWLQNLLSSSDNPHIGCFAGRIEAYEPRTLAEQFAAVDEENHDQEHSLKKGYLPAANTANVAYRREVFQKIGLFRSDLRSGGDAELTWRFVQNGEYGIDYNPDAVVYHKHRTSIRDLYRQHIKYGESITDLLKLYPESCDKTFWFLVDAFRSGWRGMVTLPGNLLRYRRGEAAKVDVWFDLLRSLCRFGLVVGRIKANGRRSDGRVSGLTIVRYLVRTSVVRLRDFILYS
jgi:cellulose synthase/poly-beta-1,6-N-acetylglucosamine synthase-like glycosyltransferase